MAILTVTRFLLSYMKKCSIKHFIVTTTISLLKFAADLSGSPHVSQETMGKLYYTGSYSSDHWALQPYESEDPKAIGLAYYKGSEYAIYVNPTDKRGYRCIVRFISNQDMESTINRDYSFDEQRGLSLVVELVENAFRNITPIVQTFKAGNNSHRFDLETRITHVGKAEEPSFLHTHIIGRGDPEAEYIAGIKMDGPLPGLNFDMMGKTLSEPGNDKKVKWDAEDMAKAVYTLKTEIEKIKKEYEEAGLMVITDSMSRNSFCEVYLIRHGQTDWNMKGILQGHTDEPLNVEGEEQALVLRQKLEKIRFAAAFSSDLSRAYKTAGIVLDSQNVKIVKSPALRERSMGAWEGQLVKDLKSWLEENEISTNSFSEEEFLSYKLQDDIESYSEVYARLNNFIKTEAISRLGSTILLSSHGGVLRALLYHHDFQPALKWQVTNCAYIKLLVNQEGEITIAESEGTKLVTETNNPL